MAGRSPRGSLFLFTVREEKKKRGVSEGVGGFRNGHVFIRASRRDRIEIFDLCVTRRRLTTRDRSPWYALNKPRWFILVRPSRQGTYGLIDDDPGWFVLCIRPRWIEFRGIRAAHGLRRRGRFRLQVRKRRSVVITCCFGCRMAEGSRDVRWCINIGNFYLSFLCTGLISVSIVKEKFCLISM